MPAANQLCYSCPGGCATLDVLAPYDVCYVCLYCSVSSHPFHSVLYSIDAACHARHFDMSHVFVRCVVVAIFMFMSLLFGLGPDSTVVELVFCPPLFLVTLLTHRHSVPDLTHGHSNRPTVSWLPLIYRPRLSLFGLAVIPVPRGLPCRGSLDLSVIDTCFAILCNDAIRFVYKPSSASLVPSVLSIPLAETQHFFSL